YQEFLFQVELIQVEQMAVLRCLIKHHGLKRVYIERFTPDHADDFQTRIDELREAEAGPADLRRRGKTREDLPGNVEAGGEGRGGPQWQAEMIERDIARMLAEYRLKLLEIGAAGRLLVLGDLAEVLPLDDASTLEGGRPKVLGGKLVFDSTSVARRHAAMV